MINTCAYESTSSQRLYCAASYGTSIKTYDTFWNNKKNYFRISTKAEFGFTSCLEFATCNALQGKFKLISISIQHIVIVKIILL